MWTQFISLIKGTFEEWREDNAARLAAALAYYTTFSLAPLLVLVIAIAGLLGGREAAQSHVMGQISSLVGVQGGEFVKSMLQTASHPATGVAASLISAATLLFGALGAFGELQNSLNTIWDVRPKPAKNFLQGVQRYVVKRILSFTIVIGIGFLLLVTLVVSAGLAAIGHYLDGLSLFRDFWLQLINFVISFLVVTILFMMIFKVLPEVHIAWKDVLLGAAVTSLLFNIGKFLIGLYLGRSSMMNTFGTAGSLALLLIWIYYSAQILFLGAEFTQVYAKQFRRDIQPESGMEVIPEHLARNSQPAVVQQ
ncbi:MAG TPA: YihY/virulence factor BrkB family protein [Anaerolineales bacterium]